MMTEYSERYSTSYMQFIAVLYHNFACLVCCVSALRYSVCNVRRRKDIETYQRLARQRLDKQPALHSRNNRTAELCNPFLGNGSVNTLPARQ
jgi:hypothetical protein